MRNQDQSLSTQIMQISIANDLETNYEGAVIWEQYCHTYLLAGGTIHMLCQFADEDARQEIMEASGNKVGYHAL